VVLLTAEGNPTYNIDLGSSFAFPHLYKFENNQLKSYKFRTRIRISNQTTHFQVEVINTELLLELDMVKLQS
jgi:hypothetical protein